MIIDNPDAFKTWLTAILEPLCDADPAALAKYVYALVKKDKPISELRDGMLDQLDVFLQQETKPFVDMLFKSLESQEYLKNVEEKQPSPPPEPEPDQEQPVENHVAMPNGTEPERPDPKPEAEAIVNNRPRSPGVGPAPQAAAAAVAVAGAGAGAGQPVRHRLVVQRTGPHHEQTLVKVLPLTELLEEPIDQPPRRRDRRNDAVREKYDRRRRRSRSWERRALARRHPRPDDHGDRARRPISRSPSPRGRYRNRSPPALDRPPTRSRSRSPVPRDRERLRLPRELERDRISRDREHRDRLSRERERERSRDRSRERSVSPHPDSRLDHDGYNKRRCRDFDEKGYCMRGDLCQWDHGTDPVVLEDAALSRVLAIPPPVAEYNPLAPDIWMGGAGGFPHTAYPPPHPPHHLPPHPPRELIPIPRIRQEMAAGPGGNPAMVSGPRHPAPHKKNFDYNRLGPARPPPLPANAAHCSLEVKKVPRGLNDITHLNNHFSKFGKIVNIQVCFENDPERALITFSTPAEASVAYKSTEAVLNNRFIKVFWHNPENKQENMAPSNQNNNKPMDRGNNQYQMSHNKVLINRDNMKATADNKQQQQQLLQQQQQNEKLKEQANGESVAKEPVKKPIEKSKQVMEMHKRAQALLETQLQQQLLLIQKLESGNVTGPQKTALLEAINSAQEGIEKLRKELVAYNKTLRQIQVKKPKTREEAQKEILDAELDMFTKQQEGQDVTELAKKIAELRKQMSIQFPTHPAMRRPHARGGRFNPASRFRTMNTNKVSMNQVVDHRPRALLISGFESDDLDGLVPHFAQFGEITGKEVNLAVPELMLQYKARAHAEQAALRGRHYNDRTLSITWVANKASMGAAGTVGVVSGSGAAPADSPVAANSAKDADNHKASTELSEDSLLRFDEEEDDDNEEDRSWRR